MNKRRNTRSQVWPDTKATIKVAEAYGGSSRRHITITGTVQNLGAKGFFIETEEIVPVPARTDIVINFDPDSKLPTMAIKATGETVHINKEGIGIRFTSIDLNKLQKCIVAKMNKLEEEAKYTLTED